MSNSCRDLGSSQSTALITVCRRRVERRLTVSPWQWNSVFVCINISAACLKLSCTCAFQIHSSQKHCPRFQATTKYWYFCVFDNFASLTAVLFSVYGKRKQRGKLAAIKRFTKTGSLQSLQTFNRTGFYSKRRENRFIAMFCIVFQKIYKLYGGPCSSVCKQNYWESWNLCLDFPPGCTPRVKM